MQNTDTTQKDQDTGVSTKIEIEKEDNTSMQRYFTDTQDQELKGKIALQIPTPHRQRSLQGIYWSPIRYYSCEYSAGFRWDVGELLGKLCASPGLFAGPNHFSQGVALPGACAGGKIGERELVLDVRALPLCLVD